MEDECGCCNGEGIPEGACGCQSVITDDNIYENYVIESWGYKTYDCNNTTEYPYPENDCTGVCGGSTTVDVCGECDGPGAVYDCPNEEGQIG